MSHTPNFFTDIEPPRAEKKKRKKTLLIILTVIILLIVGWFIAMAIAAGQVLSSALDGRDALYRARDAAIELDFETASIELVSADEYFSKAEKGFVVLKTAKVIPWVGTQVSAAESIVVSGRSVISALIDIVDIGAELVRLSGMTTEDIQAMTSGLSPKFSFNDLSLETKRNILERLSNSASDLELTEAKIALAIDELDRIPTTEVVGPVQTALVPVSEKLKQMQQVIHTLSIAAHLLPEFAGLGEDKEFLLLFLNNAELRPGGGFIGSYGVLNMRDGEIKQLSTKDVYTLDYAAEPYVGVVPPLPLTDYNATSKWFFRDSNWSPDFVMSSKKSLELFNQEINALPDDVQPSVQPDVNVQGVIGFTPSYASELLKITGPISAGGQTFNAENIFDKLEYQVEFGYKGQNIPLEQRKEILADMVDEMKIKLFAIPLTKWLDVVDATVKSLEEKQFIVYSKNPDTQSVIERFGWGGIVRPQTADAQMIVDANLASLKSDPAVERDITYEIFKNTNGQYIGRTSINYLHTGTFDWKTSRYRTYTRLYVPLGSEFIKVTGSLLNDKTQNPSNAPGPVDIGEELGMTVFGTFTSIEPGENRDLIFEYILSEDVVEAIDSGAYSLEFIKQIGADDHELTLELDFDKNVTQATPSEGEQEWGDDIYKLNTILDQDLIFHVNL